MHMRVHVVGLYQLAASREDAMTCAASISCTSPVPAKVSLLVLELVLEKAKDLVDARDGGEQKERKKKQRTSLLSEDYESSTSPVR